MRAGVLRAGAALLLMGALGGCVAAAVVGAATSLTLTAAELAIDGAVTVVEVTADVASGAVDLAVGDDED